jgi:uncharacterized protein (DUF1800 family)
MRQALVAVAVAVAATACAGNPKPSTSAGLVPEHPDSKTILHVLNRTGFGPRPGDIERVRAQGVVAYLDEQLHPERIAEDELPPRLALLTALTLTPHAFATDFYSPMIAARQAFTNTQKDTTGTTKLPYLQGRVQPIAAATLPGGARPVVVLQQPALTQEEVLFQRKNQEVFDQMQASKVLRAVYSKRQLEEVLTDFWFNHFNVDARKIEDRPVVAAYEREVIRPHVLGRFRDLLGATAMSPAMLFYLDNWLSNAPPVPPKPRPGTRAASPAPGQAGRGLNENYGRELMELHTLGVDGGYTQRDVIDVARCFTGWTMKNPRDGLGFVFNDKMHDHGEKHVLGHRIKAGGGIEDGETVLDILARHPATARFIATQLVRRLVSDDPPQGLVDRIARTFRRTDGDLREVVSAILTSPEFFAPEAYRAKVKSPFEFVVSTLRASNANITNVRSFVGTIAAMGEPLYQYQAPTGYGDRADVWVNTGTLISRLNFSMAFAANGQNAASVDPALATMGIDLWAAAVLADDLSPATRGAIQSIRATPPIRIGLLLGSPEFQRR